MSNCAKHLACKTTEQDYLDRIQQTMPRGIIWNFDDREYPKFWHTIADLLTSLSNYLCDVINEWFPCTTNDLLIRHADIWGYPVECIGYPQTTQKLCEWVELVNSDCVYSSLGFIKKIITFMGIDGVTVKETSVPELIFNIDASKFAPIEGVLKTKETGCDETGCDPCEEVLGISFGREVETGRCCNETGCDECNPLIPELNCLVQRFVQAHVTVTYNEII